MSLKLPHISRFISASTIPVLRDFSLWSILTGLIAFNVYTALSRSFVTFQPLLIAVIRKPSSIDSHINVAYWYRQNGLLNKAKHELLLATSDPSVLGAQTSAKDLLASWENEPERMEKAYRYWLGVIQKRQDYRDAYIALAALSYQLGYTAETKNYVGKIQAIDPGFPMNQEFAALTR